jgi:hypothetical protein
LSQIDIGKAGQGGPFEIFATTYTEPAMDRSKGPPMTDPGAASGTAIRAEPFQILVAWGHDWFGSGSLPDAGPGQALFLWKCGTTGALKSLVDETFGSQFQPQQLPPGIE